MKAEGAEVRSHPVVSQLVWLKELDQHLQPLDKRLKKKIQKAAAEVRKRSKIIKPSAPTPASPVVPARSVKTKVPLTLAERLEKLRGKVEKKDRSEGSDLRGKPLTLDSTLSNSLLKLPKRRAELAGDGPADLDEIDPTLGAWLPSSSLSQQLSEVQQHLRERKAKDIPQASDKNPEARARQHREKMRLETDGPEELAPEAEDEDEGLEDEMIQEAKANAKAKKEKKEAAIAAKAKAKVARQYHPEVKIEAGSVPLNICTYEMEYIYIYNIYTWLWNHNIICK